MTVIVTSAPALTYSTNADDQTFIVAPDITIAGLDSINVGSQLINYGTIYDSTNFGVGFLETGGGHFTNKADGLVMGQTNGVEIRSLGHVTNQGAVFGITGHGISVQTGSNASTIVNSGDIYGLQGGITISSATAFGVRITNTGEIFGDTYGIWLTGANAAPVIVNSGVVNGRAYSIYATDGDRLNITNAGTLNGGVKADTANGVDRVVNNGMIVGDVQLGSGNDVFSGTGRVTATVNGDAGDDVLTGGRFGDRLFGGTQNDTLTGGLGIDSLTGGAGNDFFVFSAPVTAANRDYILDYRNITGDNDTIRLENAYFTKVGNPGLLKSAAFKLSTQVKDADDRIIYNKALGLLYYDRDGSGVVAPVLIAEFGLVKPTLTYADFFVI